VGSSVAVRIPSSSRSGLKVGAEGARIALRRADDVVRQIVEEGKFVR